MSAGSDGTDGANSHPERNVHARVGEIIGAAEDAAVKIRQEAEQRLRARIAEADRAAANRVKAAEEEAAEIVRAAHDDAVNAGRDAIARGL